MRAEPARHPEIRERLRALSEEEYRAFSARLLPSHVRLMGVRLPALRRLAREVARGDWRGWLDTADSVYFEEIMLQGMVIGCAKAELDEVLERTAAFVPLIDNWSVCDSFCSGLKVARDPDKRARIWEFLQPYFSSPREFDVRFAVVMGLFYYINDDYLSQLLALLDAVRHEGYYARMAVAWAVSICYVQYPAQTMAYLESCRLDAFTYAKALQKILESHAVPAEEKRRIRCMKQGIPVRESNG